MGVHLSPVGPLPASVYWRRRAALLLGLFLLLLVLRACTGGEDPEPATESLAAAAAAAAAASPAPAATAPRPTVTAPPVPATTPAAATPGPAVANCADEDLSVSVHTDEARYAVDGEPRLTMRIANGSDRRCRRGLGSGSVELRVLSGSDRIWSSDDCGDEGRAGVAVLAPGERATTTVAWEGRRSRPGCSGAEERMRPGTYRVLGRVGKHVVEGGVFTVVP